MGAGTTRSGPRTRSTCSSSSASTCASAGAKRSPSLLSVPAFLFFLFFSRDLFLSAHRSRTHPPPLPPRLSPNPPPLFFSLCCWLSLSDRGSHALTGRRYVCRRQVPIYVHDASIKGGMSRSGDHAVVKFPKDADQKALIDLTAEYIAKEGHEFERAIMERERGIRRERVMLVGFFLRS
eukprot:1105779-Rhodomonas_salina.1